MRVVASLTRYAQGLRLAAKRVKESPHYRRDRA